MAKEAMNDDDYKNKKKIFLERFGQEEHLFKPKQPMIDLGGFLSRISTITTSTVGTKLKIIAKVSD